MWQAGATLHRGARASHCRGLSRCGAQAPDVQAQQLWLTGPAAPWHVGSSQTRARTRVPCIGRQILNHCATREARYQFIDSFWKEIELQIVPKRAHKTKGALVLPKAVVHLQVYKSIVHFSMPGFFYECLDFSRPKQLGDQSEIKQA